MVEPVLLITSLRSSTIPKGGRHGLLPRVRPGYVAL